jgi:hypothetical protein
MRPKCRGHCERQGVPGLAEDEEVHAKGCCFKSARLSRKVAAVFSLNILSLISDQSYPLIILIQC